MDYNPNSTPNRKRWVKDRYKLSLTLQLSRASGVTTGGPYPVAGSTFTYPVQNEAAAPTFVVISTPEKRSNDGAIEVAEITCEQAIGAVTTT